MSEPIRFALIGAGWRAEFFLRIAQALPQRFSIVGVSSRRPERRDELQRLFGVPVFADAQEMLQKTKPLFAVVSVPRAASPAMIRLATEAGCPVLAETPPAGTLEEMIALCDLARNGAKIQVAEQYPFQPQHAARLAFLASGKMGQLSYVQISITHGYHAMALVRKILNVGFACPTVSGRRFTAPVIAGPGRTGCPTTESITASAQDFVYFDFGNKLALYDFAGAQYFSYIRRQRLLVRGERGEMVDDNATYLPNPRQPISVDFHRHEAGPNGNLEGFYLKGIQAGEQWIYENPLAPARLSDDEIAVGTCLLKMAQYVQTGQPFYSLAEACQDAYLEQVANEALSTGKAVQAQPQPWAS